MGTRGRVRSPERDIATSPRSLTIRKSCKNYPRGPSPARETNLGKVLHWLTKRFGVGFRKVRNNGGPCSFFNSMFDVEFEGSARLI